MFCCMILIILSTTSRTLAGERAARLVFPIGELFEPLVADPKEPQFSAGIHRVDSSGRLGQFTAGVVSYGEHFGLIRWQTANKQQWQLSVVGALFAQFNMIADSKDLINADYTVGVSGTHRRGPLSYRLRILHQSTHLGDELLLSDSAPERINFSLEATDFLASYQWEVLRIYGGMGYLWNVEPSNLHRTGLQAGAEFHDTKHRLFGGRGIGGIDLIAFEADNWDINTALKFGLEYGKRGSGNRRIRVMLELYDGNAPFRQFYDVAIKSYGAACYLLF